MAFIGAVWSVDFLFKDNNGNTASCSVWFPPALLETQIQSRAEGLAEDLQNISNASLTSFYISKVYVNDAPVAPVPESEVERKLLISLGTATREKAGSLQVPSPDFVIEIEGTDVVDTTNSLVVSLREELELGGIGPGNGIVTWFGDDITRTGAPVIVHRNRKPKR